MSEGVYLDGIGVVVQRFIYSTRFIFCLSLVTTLLYLNGCSERVGGRDQGRPPNSLEDAYIALAQDLKNDVFCSKIFSKSFRTYGFNPKGFQISFLQSDCLLNLARQTKNPLYCKNIKSLSTWLLDGSSVSYENCLLQVGETTERDNVTVFSFDAKVLMSALGYSEEIWSNQDREEYSSYIRSNATQEQAAAMIWHSYYLRKLKDRNFILQLEGLPAFTE